MNEQLRGIIDGAYRFESRRYLPSRAGIYIVYDDNAVYYVGGSVNIRRRWSNYHHRKEALTQIDNAMIGWIELSSDELAIVEHCFIQWLRPLFNDPSRSHAETRHFADSSGVRRNIYFSDELDQRITEYINDKGIGRSPFLQDCARLIIDGTIEVPFLGTLHPQTDFDEIQRRLDAAKEQGE